MDPDSSEHVLQSTLYDTMLTWRAELEDTLPSFAWDAAIRERIRSDISEKDDGMSRLEAARCVCRHNQIMEPSSNAHLSSYKDVTRFNNDMRVYPKFFPLGISNSLQVVISDDEKQEIMGIWPDIRYSGQTKPSGKGMTDQFTGERIFLYQMSATKIRKDLYILLQKRLFSDMQIIVPTFQKGENINEERMISIFPCHKSILAARSPYFHTILSAIDATEIAHEKPRNLFFVPLPSPPFSPVTVDFTLRFLYTGVLQFPLMQFTSDCSTTIALYRASQYLEVLSLKALIVARIIADMLHGCFSAFLDTTEYHQLTGGKWTNMVSRGGCSCLQCARQAPRILAFALEPSIQDPILERGARRALVGMFGTQWCTMELGSLPGSIHASLLASLSQMITPINALSLLFAAEEALLLLNDALGIWDKPIRALIMSARRMIDDVICKQPQPSFECDEWVGLVASPAYYDSTGKIPPFLSEGEAERKMGWIIDALSRGVDSPLPLSDVRVTMIYMILTFQTDSQVPLGMQNTSTVRMMEPLKQHLFDIMMESELKQTTTTSNATSPESSTLHLPTDPTRPASTIEFSEGSVYSYPSSRTMSTDYGLYYTRLAISEDSHNTITPRRRQSWDTLSLSYDGGDEH